VGSCASVCEIRRKPASSLRLIWATPRLEFGFVGRYFLFLTTTVARIALFFSLVCKHRLRVVTTVTTVTQHRPPFSRNDSILQTSAAPAANICTRPYGASSIPQCHRLHVNRRSSALPSLPATLLQLLVPEYPFPALAVGAPLPSLSLATHLRQTLLPRCLSETAYLCALREILEVMSATPNAHSGGYVAPPGQYCLYEAVFNQHC
jgi:hypothetical protein